MWIIGCDFHPSWQQVAWFNSETGESGEAKLENGNGEAERWYGQLPVPSLIGLEATGNAQWFVEMLQQLGHEVWSPFFTRVRISTSLCRWISNCRISRCSADGTHSRGNQIGQLDQAAEETAQRDKMAQLLRTQPGVGPITALAFVVTIGEVTRFQRSKQVSSYVGLIPREHSSGGKQRLGGISKQGNRFLRQLLVEAAQSAVRYDESLRRPYQQRCHRKPKGVAKVAAARQLAVRLYWMLRTNTAYPEIVRIESSPRVPRVGAS